MRFLHIVPLAISLASAQVTRDECVEQGGVVVGDIGNGAIFSPDYLCEINNEPPTDQVVPQEGEPIAIEGEVCCGGTGPGFSTTFDDPFMGDDTFDDTFIGGFNETFEEITTGGGINVTISGTECEEMGGVIVGDIGDGAIFQPDYLCTTSGLPPMAIVVATDFGTIAIEGQVCCGLIMEMLNSTFPEIAEREELTREECLEKNGTLVADIGDGSSYLVSYVCESNGQPPIANIINFVPPFADEGEVCCGEYIPVDEEAEERDEVSRQECEELGGEIVGDIGDGSTRRPDYLCESSGSPPIANIVPLEGEPIAREGEVCCSSGVDKSSQTEQSLESHESGAATRVATFAMGLLILVVVAMAN